jgi:hypothetical protein
MRDKELGMIEWEKRNRDDWMRNKELGMIG